MIYNPPATDAVLLNPDLSVNGPVNPEICASRADCSALVENLKGAKIIPPGGTVLIQDEPWTESASIRYGKDGRRVFGIHFTAANGIPYWENVELLFVWWRRQPYPGAQWKLTSMDLIRVGNTVGAPMAADAPHTVLLRRAAIAPPEQHGALAWELSVPLIPGLQTAHIVDGLVSPHFPLLAPSATA